jgi:hypothetical protein
MQICGSREGGGRHHQLVTRAAPVVEKTHATTGTSPPMLGLERTRCRRQREDPLGGAAMQCTFVGLCEDPWCGVAIFVRDCPLEGSDVISGIGDAVQFNPLIYEPRQATAGGFVFFLGKGPFIHMPTQNISSSTYHIESLDVCMEH